MSTNIDSLIKKFSTNGSSNAMNFTSHYNTTPTTTIVNSNNSNNKQQRKTETSTLVIQPQQELHATNGYHKQNTATSVASSKSSCNSSSNNDKTNFYNTLKSIFALFDPECKGFIDINELEHVPGARNVEIVRDVINYIRMNHRNNKEQQPNKLNSLPRNNRINFYHRHHHQQQQQDQHQQTNTVSPSSSSSESSSVLGSSSSTSSSSSSPTSNKLQNEMSSPYLVSFDSFVKAAEVVTNSRKLQRLAQEQQQQRPLNENLYPGASNSLTSISTMLKNSNNNNTNYSTEPSPSPPQTASFYLAPTSATFSYQQQDGNRYNRNRHAQQQHSNGSYRYATNQLQTPSLQTLPMYASIPLSASTGAISTLSNQSKATTLSQAFEAHQAIVNGGTGARKASLDTASKPERKELSMIDEANSFDMNFLLENESNLLKSGLDDIESLRAWFHSQLKENLLKKSNIHKLKHQNLLSIDKMLLDLKKLSDMNIAMKRFLDEKKLVPELSNGNGHQNSLPSYEDYVEHFDLNKTDQELDKCLDEKRQNIDNLNKEKSLLIRRLYELKSASSNITKNIQQIQNKATAAVSSYPTTAIMPIDSQANSNYSFMNLNTTNNGHIKHATNNNTLNSTIRNYIGLNDLSMNQQPQQQPRHHALQFANESCSLFRRPEVFGVVEKSSH